MLAWHLRCQMSESESDYSFWCTLIFSVYCLSSIICMMIGWHDRRYTPGVTLPTQTLSNGVNCLLYQNVSNFAWFCNSPVFVRVGHVLLVMSQFSSLLSLWYYRDLYISHKHSKGRNCFFSLVFRLSAPLL